MSDLDPWEQRFLSALTAAIPEAPPAEGFLFRKSLITRVWPTAKAGALVLAAAELLEEEGLTRPRILGLLRGALTVEPAPIDADWFWLAGRGDLRPLVDASRSAVPDRCTLTRLAWPVVAALAVGVIARGM